LIKIEGFGTKNAIRLQDFGRQFSVYWPNNCKNLAFEHIFLLQILLVVCNNGPLLMCRSQGFGARQLECNFLIWRIRTMAKKRDSLIVASKVKAYIKSKKMMTSSEALGAISDRVYCMLDAAITRTKANRRSTVKAQDL
jgi:hypothetical protein